MHSCTKTPQTRVPREVPAYKFRSRNYAVMWLRVILVGLTSFFHFPTKTGSFLALMQQNTVNGKGRTLGVIDALSVFYHFYVAIKNDWKCGLVWRLINQPNK